MCGTKGFVLYQSQNLPELHRCYYPQTLRDSVCPVCRIFIHNLFFFCLELNEFGTGCLQLTFIYHIFKGCVTIFNMMTIIPDGIGICRKLFLNNFLTLKNPRKIIEYFFELKFYSILVSLTTAWWIHPPSHAWATRTVVRTPKKNKIWLSETPKQSKILL